MHDLESNGYAVPAMSLDRGQSEYLAGSLPSGIGAGRAGVRNLISHPAILALLHHQSLGDYLWSAVGRNLVAVKATLFENTLETNWHAQWHQDRAIAVRERRDVTGYHRWNTKSGVLHVDPPTNVLEQMLAVRIHLDASTPANGPLNVIPGTHRGGKLSETEIAESVSKGPVVEISAEQGGLLIMRPLLVHRSRASETSARRRVLHIEFAPVEAISPLQWHTTISLRRAA